MAIMTVISDRDLEGKRVISRYADRPLLTGPGDTRWWCGHCGELVLDGVDLAPLEGVVFRCNCGAYNVPPS